MTKAKTQAAGESGHEPIVATTAEAKSGAPPKPGATPGATPRWDGDARPGFAASDNKLETDDDFRRFAETRLADQLDYGASLVARAEHLAELPQGDRLNPLFAAARLMNATARVARELALLARVERRQRTIVERVQPSVPLSPDSNSTLEDSLERELRLKMLRYMQLFASETFDGPLEKAAAFANKAPGSNAPQ